MKWNESRLRYDKLGPKVVENLKKRHFDAYYVSTREEAIEKFFEIVPKDHVVSWGGTCTMDELELKPMREKRAMQSSTGTKQNPWKNVWISCVKPSCVIHS